MARDNEFEWNQLIKLGDMMGDGLHHEEPWISKEYTRVLKRLEPDIFTEIRKKRNTARDESIKKRLVQDRCKKCEGEMKQVRSGSLVVTCNNCGARYKYIASKIKSKK